MLLDAITQVELFVNVFTTVYVLDDLIAYLLTSWVQLPYSLRPVQRFSPTSAIRTCASGAGSCRCRSGRSTSPPMVGILALIVLDRIVVTVLSRLH